jgi:hypothetical protein
MHAGDAVKVKKRLTTALSVYAWTNKYFGILIPISYISVGINHPGEVKSIIG